MQFQVSFACSVSLYRARLENREAPVWHMLLPRLNPADSAELRFQSSYYQFGTHLFGHTNDKERLGQGGSARFCRRRTVRYGGVRGEADDPVHAGVQAADGEFGQIGGAAASLAKEFGRVA